MTLNEMIHKAQQGSRFPFVPSAITGCECEECARRRDFVLLLEKVAERPN